MWRNKENVPGKKVRECQGNGARQGNGGSLKKSAKKKWQDKEKSSTKNGSTNRDQSPLIVEEGPKKHAQSKRA